MKKYFLIILLFILSSCITKYKTDTIFEDEEYRYNITYPVSKYNEWFLFHGSTDATVYEIVENEFLNTIAIINKVEIEERTVYNVPREEFEMYTSNSTNGSIEIFVIDKNSTIYKNMINKLINNIKNIFVIDMSDIKNNKAHLPFKYIRNWYNKNGYENLLNIVIYTENNKMFLLTFKNNSINKKETVKEFYDIVNSLTREKIK